MPRMLIDAHLDLAWNSLAFNRDLELELATIRENERHMTDDSSRGRCTVCLPELRRAHVSMCVATLLARSGPAPAKKDSYARFDLDYVNQLAASAVARGQLAYYEMLEEKGVARIIRSAANLRDHLQQWQSSDATNPPIGIIIAMEGCDPITSPGQAQRWQQDGLCVASLAHYGQSHYAYGTGVDGPLSSKGRELLKEFEQAHIALDVTHLCDSSMEQALDCFGGRVLASHHNCRSLVPGERQLPDDLLKKLLERDAVIGVALDAAMLDAGWRKEKSSTEAITLEAVVDQIDHVCQMAGTARHSGIGSDLDGGFGTERTPSDLDSIADLQKLAARLEGRGYQASDIDAIFFGNWLRFFEDSLPAA